MVHLLPHLRWSCIHLVWGEGSHPALGDTRTDFLTWTSLGLAAVGNGQTAASRSLCCSWGFSLLSELCQCFPQLSTWTRHLLAHALLTEQCGTREVCRQRCKLLPAWKTSRLW